MPPGLILDKTRAVISGGDLLQYKSLLVCGIWLGCRFPAGVSADDVYAAVRARIQPQGILLMREPAFSHQWPRSGRQPGPSSPLLTGGGSPGGHPEPCDPVRPGRRRSLLSQLGLLLNAEASWSCLAEEGLKETAEGR